jgi:DNA-binding LacI/PurR family transcriptional regulator
LGAHGVADSLGHICSHYFDETAPRSVRLARRLTLPRRTPHPTALLCLSDRLAEGALRAAARFGLLIPDELSIVAFDDAVPLAANLNVTTVRQPSRDKGECAARALLDPLAGHQVPPRQLLPTELVVRGSSAHPTQGLEPN